MWRLLCVITLVATTLACTPDTRSPSSGGGSTSSAGEPPPAPKTLAAGIRYEPTSLAAKPVQQSGVVIGSTVRLFNAGLVVVDDHGQAVPYLAELLPTLNTDSWKVFDDGTMETTYRLRPQLTWHDGEPLTADDLVFAWQVYTNPAFGLANVLPQSLMSEVRA